MFPRGLVNDGRALFSRVSFRVKFAFCIFFRRFRGKVGGAVIAILFSFVFFSPLRNEHRLHMSLMEH